MRVRNRLAETNADANVAAPPMTHLTPRYTPPIPSCMTRCAHIRLLHQHLPLSLSPPLLLLLLLFPLAVYVDGPMRPEIPRFESGVQNRFIQCCQYIVYALFQRHFHCVGSEVRLNFGSEFEVVDVAVAVSVGVAHERIYLRFCRPNPCKFGQAR